MDADLETRLRQMLDKQDIWSVLLRYGRGLDRLDYDIVRSCYHDDAIDDHHAFVGTPEAFIDWAFQDSMRSTTVTHHGVNNHSCELDGDNAYCETYYTFIGAYLGPTHLLSIGRYVDHFQCRNGEWKIANRVCVIEKLFELHEMPVGTPQADGNGIGAVLPATRDLTDLSYHRPVVPRRPLSERK